MNHPCMDVHVESIPNWLVSYHTISCSQTSSSSMSQCLFYMYSVSYNMKEQAFTMLNLVLWGRYSVLTSETCTIDIPIRPKIAAFPIRLFCVDLCSSNT